MSPIAKRRWRVFRSNRRASVSLILLFIAFVCSLFAEFIANDDPILVKYKGRYLAPIFFSYSEKDTFGGVLEGEADYTDPYIINEVYEHGWMVMPPIPFDYRAVDFAASRAPFKPMED